MSLVGIALFACLTLVACGGSPARTCTPVADFVYLDQRCDAPSPSGAVTCTQVGDGACHLRCDRDDECPPAAPYCATLGLFAGGDFSCNASVRICRGSAKNDCPLTTSPGPRSSVPPATRGPDGR